LVELLKHLDLESECIEIGGASKEHRGYLACYLNTTIPRGHNIHLCHACHNGDCCNPKHLYWGTRGENENEKDKYRSGKKINTYWNQLVEKYGREGASEIMRQTGSKGGGKGNRFFSSK